MASLRRPSSSLLVRVLTSSSSSSAPSSSSCPSIRSLSSSSSMAAVKIRQLPKVKVVVAKRNGPANPRRRGSSYNFDKTLIETIVQEPISFDHIPRFTPGNVSVETIGQLQQFPLPVLKEIRAWGHPTTQSAGTLPFTVPRELTLEFTDKLNDVKTETISKPESHKHHNWMLWGNSGTGKTHLMMQTLVHANQTGWITMFMPDATRHTKNLYPYHYSPHTKTFHQPTLASFLLTHLSAPDTANASLLSQIPLPADTYSFRPDVAPGIGGSKLNSEIEFKRTIGGDAEGEGSWERTAKELAELGAKDESISMEVLEKVLEIIAGQDKVPILIAIDHIQAYFRETLYKTPELNTLESYHLSVPRLLLDYLSGRKNFARGATLTSITPLNNRCRISPSFLHGLSKPTNAFPLGSYFTFSKHMYPPSPHDQIHPWHSENARGMELVEVPEGVKLKEAKGLWEIKVVRRRLHTVNSDDNFLAKYLEVAGNPREFFRAIDISTL
ncbi:mitochondrial ribosomal death-associated protein 3-domain-containing protein [Mrakia frigida]|uniref:mitochondrial 37S ribosomal protein mS29 RSM23 n=1 Tax=Mrakia frigida TaxID=29902 RepID=UPI003FCBFEDE